MYACGVNDSKSVISWMESYVNQFSLYMCALLGSLSAGVIFI